MSGEGGGMSTINAEESRQITEGRSQFPIGKEREHVWRLYDVPNSFLSG